MNALVLSAGAGSDQLVQLRISSSACARSHADLLPLLTHTLIPCPCIAPPVALKNAVDHHAPDPAAKRSVSVWMADEGSCLSYGCNDDAYHADGTITVMTTMLMVPATMHSACCPVPNAPTPLPPHVSRAMRALGNFYFQEAERLARVRGSGARGERGEGAGRVREERAWGQRGQGGKGQGNWGKPEGGRGRVRGNMRKVGRGRGGKGKGSG